MNIKTYVIHRHVKGQDLNHHGTLFAGRGAEWFVEAGLIAAASLTSPEKVVCMNIHGIVFAPIHVSGKRRFAECHGEVYPINHGKYPCILMVCFIGLQLIEKLCDIFRNFFFFGAFV